MSGASPLAPSLEDQRVLLAGARALGGAWGSLLELCILSLCLPWEAAAIELQRVDWDEGFVPIPARGGATRALALSLEAQKAILRIAGDAGGRGQVVTAGRGQRFPAKLFRLDRLIDRLAEAAPDTIKLPEWNFHGLRLGAVLALREAGSSDAEISAIFGRTAGQVSRGLRGDPELARIGVERWSRVLACAQA